MFESAGAVDRTRTQSMWWVLEIFTGVQYGSRAPPLVQLLGLILAYAMSALQALEAALPETAERLMEMIAELAAAGVEHRFAACQLLNIASSCMVRPKFSPIEVCNSCHKEASQRLAPSPL